MNRKQRSSNKKWWYLIWKGNLINGRVTFYAHEKQDSRVNDNRKRARIRGIQPKTCNNCFFKEIFWCFGDMMRDIENTCFRCSKQQWCIQTHLKTGRVIEILPNITKKNMWKRERNQF